MHKEHRSDSASTSTRQRKSRSHAIAGFASAVLILIASSSPGWSQTWLKMPEAGTKYAEAGNWSSLWWLPEPGVAHVKGAQVAVTPETSIPPHLIFVPPGDPPADGWPMIVFLHGQGESSPSPLPRVALQGPPQHAGRHPTSLPFVVVSPQKPMRLQFYDDEVAAGIKSLITHYTTTLSLDKQRVYLTGLSQGGIGTWNLASDPTFANMFAAIAPVCGGMRPLSRAAQLNTTPIFAFHGENDSILPVSLSDASVQACSSETRSRRAGKVKYERIADAPGFDYSWGAAGIPYMEGHASWMNAYYPKESVVEELATFPLYTWLLAHSLGSD